jgi:hypothetical protein
LEIEWQVFQIKLVVGVLLFMFGDGTGQAVMANHAPWAYNVASDCDVVVCHFGEEVAGRRKAHQL